MTPTCDAHIQRNYRRTIRQRRKKKGHFLKNKVQWSVLSDIVISVENVRISQKIIKMTKIPG